MKLNIDSETYESPHEFLQGLANRVVFQPSTKVLVILIKPVGGNGGAMTTTMTFGLGRPESVYALEVSKQAMIGGTPQIN
jgi:hypothetical protein